MNSYVKCKICGADYGLHHYKTSQCPVGGVEAPVGQEQIWMTTTFEECPAPKPTRPTGPTPQYIRELEAEAVRVKGERDRLLLIIGSAVMNNDGADYDAETKTFHYRIRSEDYLTMLSAKTAAANEAQP